MKCNSIPKPALILLIVGLLMTLFTPVINRYFPMSDPLEGFLNGIGLTIEVIALAKIQRNKKTMKCA